MWYTLSTRIHIARKKHRDNGYNGLRDWVFNSYEFNMLPVDQRSEIMAMISRENAHLIMPGERYEYSFCVGEGEKIIFKTKQRFANIIHKFEIYGED